MALEPITRQEKIIAGQDLTPITRMEKFLKNFGGSGGGGGGVQVVTFTGKDPSALTSSHTGAEILEMAEKGLVIAKIVSSQLNGVLPLVTVNSYNGAMFLMASGALLTGLGVAMDGTAVNAYNYVA